MSIIKLSDVSKSYGDHIVFDGIHLDINAGKKIGIIGMNGSGKTTLMKIIMGLEDVDCGKIEELSSTSLGYLKQATEYTLEDFIKMSEDRSRISDFLKITGELNVSDDIDFSTQRLQNLSGGEKAKIALSSILATSPSVLLLDEPTNHMDIEGINWLIDKVKHYRGTVLVVSHDRYFLNAVVNKIIEIENGKIKVYYGNYDEYQNQKEHELEALRTRYEIQQKQDRKISKEINQLTPVVGKG